MASEQLTLGKFIRTERTKQGTLLEHLALKANVELATLSRVENGHSQATLPTTVRVCTALGLTADSLLRALQADMVSPTEEPNPATTTSAVPLHRDIPRHSVLTVGDVREFVDLCRENQLEGHTSLLEMLRAIADMGREQDTSGPEITDNYLTYDLEDVRRLLQHDWLATLALRYPNLELSDILGMYRQGGVIIMDDIVHYAQRVYDSLPVLQDQGRNLLNLLERLRTGSLERVKLRDVLELDSLLGGHRVLGQYWEVALMLDNIAHRERKRDLVDTWPSNWTRGDFKVATTYILLARWLFYFDNEKVELARRYSQNAETTPN